MRKPARKTLISVVGVVFFMVIAGCEEEQKLPDTKRLPNIKRCRLIAVENVGLKKQLEQRDKEIERQKQLLEKCRQENKVLKEKSRKRIEDLLSITLGSVVEGNKKLRQQNENLKSEIENLKRELEELKNQAGPKP